jgi:hypothetical protein
MSSSNTSETNTTVPDDENEDEIKRYSTEKDGQSTTIIAVFEGDYVRFAKEMKNGILTEEKIVSQEEFEKIIVLEGWRKEKDE